MTVFLHIIGEGCDGDDRRVDGVYATEDLGNKAIEKATRGLRHRKYEVDHRHSVEEWEVRTAVEG